jgi:hypothetical protein
VTQKGVGGLENNIYEWIMSDHSPSEVKFDPILKKARSEYNLYLINMSQDAKSNWELYHRQGKEMACEALKRYRDSEVRRTYGYFSIENTPEVNDEIFAQDTKHHAEIFNKIREDFHDKPYDRERVIIIGRMEGETFTINRYWANARENVLAENQKMKELLKMAPEELVNINASVFCDIKFNGEDALKLRRLEEKYFNDPYVDKVLERIEEIVSETKRLSKQLENKWREERDKRGLKAIDGRDAMSYER